MNIKSFFENTKRIFFAIFGVVFVAGLVLFFSFSFGEDNFFFSLFRSHNISTSTASSTSSYGSDSLTQNIRPSNTRLPARKWDVLDPTVEAQAVLIQSFDENFPFFRYRVREPWPAASLTKLLTAVVVLEQYGDKKKVPISARAMTVEGIAGGLSVGEEYLSGDLIKIMLLVSSNRAAAAFEDFMGGTVESNRLLNKKAGELGMRDSIFHDASGLADVNMTSAEDMFTLIKYIYEKHPEILNWTRLSSYMVQPTNTTESRIIQSIHPFVSDKNFLGGKTGTSDAAKQNLVSVFSFKDFRIAVIILGSPDRVSEMKSYWSWIERAYTF